MAGKNNTLDVKVIHRYSATPEKVFKAWLDPGLVQKWFGPGLGHTQPVHINPVVGGTFRIVQIRDGEPVGHSGEYIAMEKPHYIAFTWATDGDDGFDEVHVNIRQVEGGASVEVVHTINEQWKEFADQTQAAWKSMMEKMDILLEV